MWYDPSVNQLMSSAQSHETDFVSSTPTNSRSPVRKSYFFSGYISDEKPTMFPFRASRVDASDESNQITP